MADLIKKIKIKKQDGTFTDYIPIGAEAQNISTSDGDSVQLKLNKKPYYYNTVADMKADTKLKVGDMAITLGYYEVNDEGAGEYQIVNGSHTDDGGSYHELNNNLFAKLIIDNKVNVKQFGAYGDGSHDDSNKIQNAINFLKNIVIDANKIYKEQFLYFSEGDYKILNAINLTPLVKIRTLGQVIISSYVSTGPSLILSPETIDYIPSVHIDQIQYLGEYLNGEGGLYLQYLGENNVSTIGFQIGHSQTTNVKLRVAHASFNNLYIKGFKIGLFLTMYNVYCDTFNRLSIGGCDTNIQIGLPNSTGNNSGERMTFNDCQFGANLTKIGINFY